MEVEPRYPHLTLVHCVDNGLARLLVLALLNETNFRSRYTVIFHEFAFDLRIAVPLPRLERSQIREDKLCNFWVIIHSIIKMAFDLGERPASQSEHFCRTNASLSDKGTARYRLATVKLRSEEIPTIVSANPRSGVWSRCRFQCNVTAVFRVAKALFPAINGLDRTSELFRTKGVLSWCVQSFMQSFMHP